MLNKEVSSTIFKVFSMTQPGIEPWSPGPLPNRVELFGKGNNGSTREMQSTSNELSTSVSDSVKCKQKKVTVAIYGGCVIRLT